MLRQMPFAEVRGQAGLRPICEESAAAMSGFEVDLLDVTAVGRKVFTERVDRFAPPRAARRCASAYRASRRTHQPIPRPDAAGRT